MKTHESMMRLALEEARKAYEQGEIPVGCVVVDPEGRVIGRGRTRRQTFFIIVNKQLLTVVGMESPSAA